MKIQNNAYVAMDYKLTNDAGELLDESAKGQPLGFVWGQQQIIPGLEAALEGLAAGDTKKVDVDAANGYGETNEELIQELPRSNFPEDTDLTEGQTFQAMTPHGPMRFAIREVKEDVVVADLNHPLSGQNLHFDVTISEVRQATEEELTPPAHSHDQGHCGDGSNDCGGCGHDH